MSGMGYGEMHATELARARRAYRARWILGYVADHVHAAIWWAGVATLATVLLLTRATTLTDEAATEGAVSRLVPAVIAVTVISATCAVWIRVVLRLRRAATSRGTLERGG